MSDSQFPYVHGFNQEEQERLWRQGELWEHILFQDVDFSDRKRVLEVGSGVGAQSQILLRRFPKIHLTGIDLSDTQIKAAEENLGRRQDFKGRFEFKQMDAGNLDFESNSFDAAYLCWVLEHMPDPLRTLSEVRRVLSPGGKIVVTEVMGHSFFLEPYCPNLWKYWMAFNDFQNDQGGDPFIGVKLGNLLSTIGFKRVETRVKVRHYDNRHPEARKEMIEFWKGMILSAADQLLQSKHTDQKIVDATKKELSAVQRDPNAVFFYAFMQAEARVMNIE
jgi:ubiquinone/menaquinone biosynthesis C-methylase UbiE